MKNFLEIIREYKPISLEEMDSVALLDRTDIKFAFNIDKLNDILLQAKDDYRVLEVNRMRYADYDTNYFDTNDYKFYYDHHNQRTNRYKVRMRSYVNSDLHFFEIKYKSNKNRTVKSRINIPSQDNEIKGEAAELLENVTGISPESLKKAIHINCKRITLVNKQFIGRVTIDFDLKYQIDEQWHEYPEMVIVEVKQNQCKTSEFIKILQNNHIHSTSLSKYSFGIANFIPGIKKNNFKTQISYVNKICNPHAV